MFAGHSRVSSIRDTASEWNWLAVAECPGPSHILLVEVATYSSY